MTAYTNRSCCSTFPVFCSLSSLRSSGLLIRNRWKRSTAVQSKIWENPEIIFGQDHRRADAEEATGTPGLKTDLGASCGQDSPFFGLHSNLAFDRWWAGLIRFGDHITAEANSIPRQER